MVRPRSEAARVLAHLLSSWVVVPVTLGRQARTPLTTRYGIVLSEAVVEQ